MASHGVPRVSGVVADKSEAAKEKERQQIKNYSELEAQVQQKHKDKEYTEEAFSLTTRLLIQNPEYYTIWNFRRLILLFFADQNAQEKKDDSTSDDARRREAAEKANLSLQQYDILLLLKEDLQFLVPLLRQFPKCYWIWDHRIWLLNEATKRLPAKPTLELWQIELGLVSKMLSLDNRNFHGWNYRRQTIAELERLSGQSMVASEFDYTTRMIKSNLSNFSAWHNRSQLIPRLLEEQISSKDDRKKFMDAELEQITTALYTDPYDQSLWFYHQYLISTLDPDAPTNHPNYPRDTKILLPMSDEDRRFYLLQEVESIKDMLDGAEDCKYIYQALLDYSTQLQKLQSASASKQELLSWLSELEKLDTLRAGRWKDMRSELQLS